MPNKYKFESVESGNPSVACKQYIQMRVLSNICKYFSIDFQTHLCLIQNKCFCEKKKNETLVYFERAEQGQACG